MRFFKNLFNCQKVKICPDCGNSLQYGESCVKCVFCGWSMCG